MAKPVELLPTAFNWLKRKPFLSEEVIIGIVRFYPTSERKYSDRDHFTVEFNRRKNKKIVRVTIFVHETPSVYYVYKMHSTGFKRHK